MLVERLRLNCGRKITGLGLVGLSFWRGVCVRRPVGTASHVASVSVAATEARDSSSPVLTFGIVSRESTYHSCRYDILHLSESLAQSIGS